MNVEHSTPEERTPKPESRRKKPKRMHAVPPPPAELDPRLELLLAQERRRDNDEPRGGYEWKP